MEETQMKLKMLIIASFVIIWLMPFSANAYEEKSNLVYTRDDLEEVLTEINNYYKIDIHIENIRDEQIKTASVNTPILTEEKFAHLKEELYHIAEFEIPEYEVVTKSTMLRLTGQNNEEITTFRRQSLMSTSIDYEPVYAVKAINYAAAAAEAYITTDSYGNTIWGAVINKFCITDRSEERWFYAAAPNVSRIDLGRTLYWVGSGYYGATYNGIEFYLHSGTQYAEMYVGSYTMQ